MRYPTAGVPRGRDGKPNLAAPAPRLPMANRTSQACGATTATARPAPKAPVRRRGRCSSISRTVSRASRHRINRGPPSSTRSARTNGEGQPRCALSAAWPVADARAPAAEEDPPLRGLLVILHERNMEFRQIFLDGRPLPADPQPSWYGYSTGRWDGDTLVVDTIGFRDGLWADFYGSPLTDQAKMTERFRRPQLRRARGPRDDRRSQGLHEAVDSCAQPAPRAGHGPARDAVSRTKTSAVVGSNSARPSSIEFSRMELHTRRSGFTRSVNTAGAAACRARLRQPQSTPWGISPGGERTFDSLIVQTLSMETSSGNRRPEEVQFTGCVVPAIGITPDDPRDLPLIVLQPALKDGVLDDVDAAVQPQLPHGVGFVRFDGLDAQRRAGPQFPCCCNRRQSGAGLPTRAR